MEPSTVPTAVTYDDGTEPEFAAMPSEPPPNIDPTAAPVAGTVAGRDGGAHPTGASSADRTPSMDAPAARGFCPVVPGFRIVREVGRGGMGMVFEAVQEGLNRTVALKVLRLATTSAVARFRAEALAVARLNHPDIVQVHAVGEFEGEPYLVLEFCSGGTLASRIAQAPLVPTEAAAVVARIARAVHAAHESGIIHRDLKPANILLAAADGGSRHAEAKPDDGTRRSSLHVALRSPHTALQPKVTDFGLAKLLGEQGGMTATGDVLGTPCYMAPEQTATGFGSIGRATDVYALGAVLYELISGRVPFRGASAMETLELVRTQPVKRPREWNPQVPADLESIALQCLEKAQRDRYASAADVADDLERWLAGEPVRARRQTLTYRVGKRLRRHRRAALALAAVVVAAMLGWIAVADAGRGVPGGSAMRDWIDDREASLFRPVPSDERVAAKAAEQRNRLRRNLLGRRFGVGWFGDPGLPMSDAWTQAQVAAALCVTPESEPGDLAALVPPAREMFEPNLVYPPYVPGTGWKHFNDNQPSAETSAWAVCGLARLLSRAPLSADERAYFTARLDMIQADLDRNRLPGPRGEPFPGGWLLFPNQQDPTIANVYVTVTILQALLDLHETGLGWRGRTAERDELLARTARWLVGRFDGAGWRSKGSTKEGYNDGLTLLVLAQLLRAERTGLVELSAAILNRVPELLDECALRPVDHPGSIGVFEVMLIDPAGKLVSSPLRTVRFPWFAWSVRLGAAWIDRLQAHGSPRRDLVRARRALARLILTTGDAVVESLDGDLTFLLAETLIGLSAVKR